MNTEPQLRVVGRQSMAKAFARGFDMHGRPIYTNEFRQRLKDARQQYFFLGWCAGLLTALLMLLAVRVEACGDLPAPDETIEQIRVVAI